MAKAGDDYQEAVAAVAQQIDPTAAVVVGEWVTGPDGERDCDVSMRATDGGTHFRLIECKDWKRRVGIEVVDALESKRRDLHADIAMIVSNSGFTADALRKAARVGIPVLCALIEGDSRIKVKVQEEIYTRKIRFRDYQIIYHFVEHMADADELIAHIKANDVIHANRPVAAWVRDRCIALATFTAKSCNIHAAYKFRRNLQFHFGSRIHAVKGIDLKIPCDIEWCSQIIQLSASAGMYDYLRHRIILGKGSQQYHMKNVDYSKWSPITFVPEHLHFAPTPPKGGAEISLGMLSGIDQVNDALAPDIDSQVEQEDIARIDLLGVSSKIHRDYGALDSQSMQTSKTAIEFLADLIKGPSGIVRGPQQY